MKTSSSRPVANVLGIPVDALDMESALARTQELLSTPGSHYICAAAVHGIVEAQRNPKLLAAYHGAALVLPDGMPLAWAGRSQGFAAMERVTGPDITIEVFRRPEFAGVTHFLYGGDQGVVEELRERLLQRFPSARIVGIYTPPFRDLNLDEERYMEDLLSTLKPDIVWVGIGCPKQELCMARYTRRWNARLMIGVGAAFDFHTGRLRDCAPWIKRAGLQWLHRLIQDPRRLWRRYLVTNCTFVYRMTLQALRRTAPSPLPQAPARATRQVETRS
ncbi:WecB/TagA/CpsF family glycosyltransferase [Granulicella sibirica]|uniref:N-acetylmannosaminyltransferase n=1 Tax=Granulicella sibirica TaxID=2479048 RepID=A0A4V1L516_9BACT|nr:WecB/TagA/CpsF family glycosyltransferase [Granulicella sibirica]RXH54194.1 N-acetylmannosaminyltransferase [Granulicella sibirica]